MPGQVIQWFSRLVGEEKAAGGQQWPQMLCIEKGECKERYCVVVPTILNFIQ